MVLRLNWRCGEGTGSTSGGYKASDPETNMGCQVNHLWDNERKFFYGYEALVGRTGSWMGFRYVGTYQTLGAALQACEARLNWAPPVRR
jgi:hypothetical protein